VAYFLGPPCIQNEQLETDKDCCAWRNGKVQISQEPPRREWLDDVQERCNTDFTVHFEQLTTEKELLAATVGAAADNKPMDYQNQREKWH